MSDPGDVEVAIEGLHLVPLTIHLDERGGLTETFRRTWLPAAREFVQANMSSSRRGVLRGLHYHRLQADYWCVLSGAAYVALFDLRSGSPTRSRKAEMRLDATDHRFGLYVPPGVAHGFYAETEVLLQYLVDRAYAGDDEFGLAWDDPDVGITWPSGTPILSDRDRSNPRLAEIADLPA
jgi:dTDP-4-dehydrorhamnose 3,5-epimerase